MSQSAHIDQFTIDHLPPAEQWPELSFVLPELQFPTHLNATTQLLDNAVAEGHGERLAMIGKGVRWTYAQLQAQVNRLARILTEDMGLQTGNRVLLRGANSPMFAALWLAVWKAGGVAVGTMPLLRAKELRQIVQLAKISHAVCDAALAEELQLTQRDEAVLQQVLLYGNAAFEQRLASKADSFTAVATAATDPALIAFTSGTTGVPKGCIHFHRDVMVMSELVPRHFLQPDASDIFIGTPPLAFTFGLGALLCFPLQARACTVLLEKLPAPDLLQAIAAHRATLCATSPTAYRQMTPLLGQYDLSSLKKCLSAGEALPTATRDKWQEATGIQMHDGIGGTEMIHIYIASQPADYRPGAIGKVLPGFTAILVDEQMHPVPTGQEGKLAIKGPTGCRYLADERQGKYVRQGWNITGDTFHQDKDGYFYYHARVDDIIVTSGYNVSSPEVESVLMEHPAVAECAVIGVADADRGQIIKAIIVLAAGFQPSDELVKELQDFTKSQVAPYKYPRAIEFTHALPRTETGKLQRFKLLNGQQGSLRQPG